jgi:hypothetical protein
MGIGRGGGTHIGFVLSFVIFIAFLVAIYSVLILPGLSQDDKRSLAESLKIRILENVSNELTTITISTESAPQNCIRLNGFLSDFNISSRIKVKDRYGLGQTAYVLGSDLEISRSGNETFFKVYESEEFDAASAAGESPCNPRDYQKGNAKMERHVFEGKITDLMDFYAANYSVLRDGFGFPEDSDFDFGFTYSNGTYAKVGRQVYTGIYSAEMPVQYVDGNSSMLTGTINVRVW